jgi:hypothetical protein
MARAPHDDTPPDTPHTPPDQPKPDQFAPDDVVTHLHKDPDDYSQTVT